MGVKNPSSLLPLRLAGLLVGLPALWGCVDPPVSQARHAELRDEAPLSVCRSKLAPVGGGRGKAVVRDLDPEQWTEVLVPGFQQEEGLEPTALDCTGHYIFANESLRGGASERGWPRMIDPDDMTVSAGPDGLRVLWLRSMKFDNGEEGGPLALARAAGDAAEIYGVGSFRGPPGAKFTPARVGNDNLLVAETKECSHEGLDCRKLAFFYLPRRGRLIEGAVIDLERTAVVPSVTQRGLFAQYKLSTDITYQPQGVLLLEQVSVRITETKVPDLDSDRELRTVEFARFLKIERDSMFSNNDPLWERVVGRD